jgi:hypothetical protein
VKLFIGMLSPEPTLFDVCAGLLSLEYGPVDFSSEVMPWDKTEYYRDEMGAGIVRKFLFFESLIDPGTLASIKKFAAMLEKDFAEPAGLAVRRRINLDPGYVTEAKVVLATAKDFAHRLYIGGNTYAEVTLRYHLKERSFAPHEYTYPDFRTAAYLSLFNRARAVLRTELRGKGGK